MDKEIKILKALAHPFRLEIIKLLAEKGEMCVCNIQDTFGSTQSNLSQHLKVLKEADILYSRKEGGWVHYSLKNKKVMDVLNILKED